MSKHSIDLSRINQAPECKMQRILTWPLLATCGIVFAQLIAIFVCASFGDVLAVKKEVAIVSANHLRTLYHLDRYQADSRHQNQQRQTHALSSAFIRYELDQEPRRDPRRNLQANTRWAK
jgi:hypothetical protein